MPPLPDASPFPLEKKIDTYLRGLEGRSLDSGSGTTRELYLDLAEPIVRAAAVWQEPDGIIAEPYPMESRADQHPSGQPWGKDWGKESATATSRFAGAVAQLVLAGRCPDLVEPGARALEAVAEGLHIGPKPRPTPGPDFDTKELMAGFRAFRGRVPERRTARWREWLGGIVPERTYVMSHNWGIYAIVGEYERYRAGLGDPRDWIEAQLAAQSAFFTPYGMYKDPNDPATYDLTVRQNLSLMLDLGYAGPHRDWIDEMLRRGGLTTLFLLSSLWQAPFGGRSNQHQFMEAMAACICEYEARRYAKLDRSHLAGAFKRTARMAAAATRRWLNERPFRHIKNGFPPETTHGIDGGHYSVYALLAANLFGVAYHMADETIPEAPAPVEVGGTAIELPGDFHKVFATCGGYHLEIDTRADLNYDATGLGRVHRTGVPSELGPSAPITSRPRYKVSVPPFSRPVAIGPAWQGRDGTWHALAGCSEEIRQVAVEVHFETEREVGFQVAYRGDLPGGVEVVERYRITSEGVEIEDEVRGDVRAIRVHLPLLATDGLRRSEIVSGEGRFEVRYAGSRYEASSSDEGVASGIEEGEAPNRNGIYRIGWLERKGERIRCRIRLA